MLSTIPIDVVLHILSCCNLEDVLSIDATCRALREITATRHHWLSRLHTLNRVCAPDLPSHVDIATLSARDLRQQVTRAVSTYRKVKRGNIYRTPSRDITVKLSANEAEAKTLLMNLLPGGRFLFVDSIYSDLRLYDLARDGHSIWSIHRRPEHGKNAPCYAVQTRSNDSARMASYFDRTCEVYDITLRETGVLSTKRLLRGRSGYGPQMTHSPRARWLQVDGDYMAFLEDAYDDSFKLHRRIVVTNLTEGWKVTIIDVGDGLEGNAILRKKHKSKDFVVRDGRFYFLSEDMLYVAPLDNFRTFMKNGKRDCEVGFSELGCASFSLASEAPLGFVLMDVFPIDICDFAWTGRKRNPIITIIAQVGTEGSQYLPKLYLVAYELELRLNGGSQEVFLRTRTKPVLYPTDQDFSQSSQGRVCAPLIIKPGRFLFYTQDLGSSKYSEATLAWVDEDGCFALMPSQYLDMLQSQCPIVNTDKYSGALVCRDADQDCVRIIYP